MADRVVSVKLRADVAQYQAALAAAAATTSAFGKSADGSGREIDKFSGRLRVMADIATMGAPALTAFGAAGVGAMAAMAGQAVALGGALGVTVLAINGVGDALKALDAYQLNPTTANLMKMRAEMEKIGPSGQNFVRFLDEIEPQLKSLQTAARDGFLPGLENGIVALMSDLPRVRDLIGEVAKELGRESEAAGNSLAGPDFENFLHYLETDGVPILHDTAHTIGNLAIAGANLVAAFAPTQTDFAGGLLRFSEHLADASKNLDKSAGFQEFLRYIDQVGPEAVKTLEAVANAALQIVEATAPLGGPTLKIITAVANVIAKIADSDLGTPIFAGLAALAAYNRALAVTATLQKSVAATNPFTLGLVVGTAAVVEFTSANDDLAGSLASIDSAKASGNIDTYTAAIDNAQKSLDDFRGKQKESSVLENALPFGLGSLTEMDKLSSWYHEFNGDNDEAQKKIDAASKSLKSFADGSLVSPINAITNAISSSADAANKDAQALEAATNAMREARSEALKGINAHLDYRSAILDANDALKKNGKTVNENTRAGQANLQTLYALPAAWNAQSDAAKNASGALGHARANFIDTAEAMGMSADKAHNLANRLFEIKPRDVTVTVEGMDPAIGKAQTLAAVLASLHSRDLTVAVHYQTFGNRQAAGSVPSAPGVQPNADGGTIGGQRHPYGDKVLSMLAPGEEVISNRYGQADRFRADRAAGRIPSYADGGFVRRADSPYANGGPFSAVNNPTGGSGSSGGGIGPNSQLYGIGQPWLSAVELGTRISNLTLKQMKSFGDDISHLSKTNLKELSKALDLATASIKKELDKEKSKRDALQQQRDEFASAVGSAYATNDPFAALTQSGSPWAAGNGMDPLGAFDKAVSGNIANTQAAQAALATAAAHGLNGPLYQALAQSGNLQLLQSFAGLSTAQIDQREAAFAAQSNAQSALGNSAAATAGMDQSLKQANKELVKIQAELHELRHDVKLADQNNVKGHKDNAKHVTDGVNGAAANGHRRGHSR